MAVISNTTVEDAPQEDGRRYVRYEYVFSQGLVTTRGPKLVDAIFDDDADRVAMVPEVELDAAWDEVNQQYKLARSLQNPDKAAVYQDQNDFDRRLLGLFMFNPNAHVVLAGYPFFQAVELRGGANSGKRATYLGVVSEEYDQVEARFNNVNGVAWFLTDEKGMIWQEYPSEDWL